METKIISKRIIEITFENDEEFLKWYYEKFEVEGLIDQSAVKVIFVRDRDRFKVIIEKEVE